MTAHAAETGRARTPGTKAGIVVAGGLSAVLLGVLFVGMFHHGDGRGEIAYTPGLMQEERQNLQQVRPQAEDGDLFTFRFGPARVGPVADGKATVTVPFIQQHQAVLNPSDDRQRSLSQWADVTLTSGENPTGRTVGFAENESEGDLTFEVPQSEAGKLRLTVSSEDYAAVIDLNRAVVLQSAENNAKSSVRQGPQPSAEETAALAKAPVIDLGKGSSVAVTPAVVTDTPAKTRLVRVALRSTLPLACAPGPVVRSGCTMTTVRASSAAASDSRSFPLQYPTGDSVLEFEVSGGMDTLTLEVSGTRIDLRTGSRLP